MIQTEEKIKYMITFFSVLERQGLKYRQLPMANQSIQYGYLHLHRTTYRVSHLRYKCKYRYPVAGYDVIYVA